MRERSTPNGDQTSGKSYFVLAFDQMTLQEISEIFGVSRERIRAIEGNTIAEVQAVLGSGSQSDSL